MLRTVVIGLLAASGATASLASSVTVELNYEIKIVGDAEFSNREFFGGNTFQFAGFVYRDGREVFYETDDNRPIPGRGDEFPLGEANRDPPRFTVVLPDDAEGYASAYGGTLFQYTLQPGDVLTFQATVSYSYDITHDGSGSIGASAFAFDRLQTNLVAFSRSFDDGVGASSFTTPLYTFSNFTSDVIQFGFQTGAAAQVEGVFQPIPEPSTYGLMLAGLGVVAFAVGRREVVRPHQV